MNEWQGKRKYSGKICPNAALSTTDPTYIELGSNPDRRRAKPTTNSLSYGTAISTEWRNEELGFDPGRVKRLSTFP
jgi:hypothetical protein